MKEGCILPEHETMHVDVLVSGRPIYEQLSTLLSKIVRDKAINTLLRFYAYIEGEALLVLLWARGAHLQGACVETVEGASYGDGCLRILSRIMRDTNTVGIIEVLNLQKRNKTLERYKFSSPLSPKRIAEMYRGEEERERREEKPAPTGLESMDGIQIGLLLSEVIVASQLLFTARTPTDALRRVRHLSRRNQGALFRIALLTKDGGIYNIFVKAGRVRRILHLSSSGIEGRVVGEEEPLRDILRRGDVVRVTVYRVSCPRCEKIILGD